jgi:hypothetical protein
VKLFDDAELRLLAMTVALLRRALLLLRLLVALSLATLGARSEEHAVLLLELRLQAFELDLQCDAILALRGKQRLG